MPTIAPAPLTRTLAEVARYIRADYAAKGRPVYFAAEPYVNALGSLRTSDLSGRYFSDNVAHLVITLLSNLGTWRGPVAKQIKTELRAALADHQQMAVDTARGRQAARR